MLEKETEAGAPRQRVAANHSACHPEPREDDTGVRLPDAALPHLRFLLLDTDPDELLEARNGDMETVLSQAETLLARLQRPAHYLKPGPDRQVLEQWLPPALMSRLPRDQTTPSGLQ